MHRLDKDTSGILVAAKSSDAQKRLVELFSTRKVYKEYLAICHGNPGTKELNSPIGRNPLNRKTMAVIENGRPALSYCETLNCDGKISLVKIELATGRTHQIRVHMKHNGTPVLGDMTYGNMQANAKYGVNRQMLHAKILQFDHPISGKPMKFEAPIPEDMSELVKKLSSKN